jgi:hypothetical protein
LGVANLRHKAQQRAVLSHALLVDAQTRVQLLTWLGWAWLRLRLRLRLRARLSPRLRRRLRLRVQLLAGHEKLLRAARRAARVGDAPEPHGAPRARAGRSERVEVASVLRVG